MNICEHVIVSTKINVTPKPTIKARYVRDTALSETKIPLSEKTSEKALKISESKRLMDATF